MSTLFQQVYPNTAAMFRSLYERGLITTRSTEGLSAAAFHRIESGETPRRDVRWLLQAREAELVRNETPQQRRRR